MPRTDDITHGWVCSCGMLCMFGGRFGGLIEQLPLFGPGELLVRTWSTDQECYGALTRMPSVAQIKERAAIVRQCRGTITEEGEDDG